MQKKRLLSLLVPALILFAPAARAEQPRLIATYQKWSVYSFTEDGKKVCYMASQPEKMEGASAKTHRGEVFALITNRPAEGSKNVFSYITGYTYKPGSGVTAAVDQQHFTLFTQDDTAWAPDGVTDNKIAAALRKGNSAKGTETTDTFNLAGSGGAYTALAKACGADSKAAH